MKRNQPTLLLAAILLGASVRYVGVENPLALKVRRGWLSWGFLCLILAGAGACHGSPQTQKVAPLGGACAAYTQGKWVAAAPMTEERHLPSMVVLADGRVLVSGGLGQGSEALATAEFYLPSTDTWVPTGPMASPRIAHKLIVLPNKTVLALGGGPGDAEVFDPATGIWSGVPGAAGAGRTGTVAASLPDGKVALVGGETQRMESWGLLQKSTKDVHLFDPGTGSWSRGPSLDTVRDGAAGAVAPDGSILVVGGHYYVPPLVRITFWDPVSPSRRVARGLLLWRPGETTWTRIPWPGAAGGRGASAVGMGSHEVLVLAGSGDGDFSRHAAVVDTRTASVRSTPPMHVARHGAVPLALEKGCVMVLGGAGPQHPAEVYSSTENVWIAMPGPPLMYFAAAVLPDGSVLVLGDHAQPRLAYRYRTSVGSHGRGR